MLYVYVCYMLMYVICLCDMFMCVYVICLCYMFMYVTCLCVLYVYVCYMFMLYQVFYLMRHSSLRRFLFNTAHLRIITAQTGHHCNLDKCLQAA